MSDKLLKRRERMRLWQAKNREKVRESNRRWAAANPDKCRKRQSKWLESLDEPARKKRADAASRWRLDNPEKHAAIQQTRRARKIGAGGSYTKDDVAKLFAIQRGKCAMSWCGKSIKGRRHVDHVVPLVLGGQNDPSNLQLLCPTCNLSKGKKHPIAFAQQNGMLL